MAKFCGKCGSPLDLQTGRCLACGWTFTPSGETLPPDTPPADTPSDMPPKKRHTALWITLGVVAVAAVVGVLAHLGGTKQGQQPDGEPNRVLVREENYDWNGTLKSYCDNEYNEDGEMIRQDYYDVHDSQDVQHTYAAYEYDDDGRVLAELWYHEDGTLDGYSAYQYNESGLLESVLKYDEDETLVGRDYYRYDNNGQLTEKGIYSDTDVWEHYEYNDEGQMVEKSRVAGGTVQYYSVLKYDEKENTVREKCYGKDSVLIYEQTYTYDEYGDLVRMDSYSNSGELLDYRIYEYAALGEMA